MNNYTDEKAMQESLLARLSSTRGITVYRTETTDAGFPDLLLCSGKSHLFIELKYCRDTTKPLFKSFQPAQLPWALRHQKNCDPVICLIADAEENEYWLELTDGVIHAILEGLTVDEIRPLQTTVLYRIKKELGL